MATVHIAALSHRTLRDQLMILRLAVILFGLNATGYKALAPEPVGCTRTAAAVHDGQWPTWSLMRPTWRFARSALPRIGRSGRFVLSE